MDLNNFDFVSDVKKIKIDDKSCEERITLSINACDYVGVLKELIIL